eukprot:573176-Prorocentrum_minimum.AAC.1
MAPWLQHPNGPEVINKSLASRVISSVCYSYPDSARARPIRVAHLGARSNWIAKLSWHSVAASPHLRAAKTPPASGRPSQRE